MTTKLTLFTATLVQDSALSVSGLDRENSADQPFAIVETTVDGVPKLVPTLVGRGLKGAAVAMARRFFDPLPRAVSDVVTAGEKRALCRSAWEFADATTTALPCLRAGVGIRYKTGARAGGVLYDREVIPARTKWQLTFRVDWTQIPEAIREDKGREAEGILGYVLTDHWLNGRCWLGGGAARGLGWCHVEDLKAYRFDEASYDKWVIDGRPREPQAAPVAVPVVSPTRSWCFRTLDVDISFGEYKPEPDEAAWGLDMFAVGPHDTERTVHPTGDGKWVRPTWVPNADDPSKWADDKKTPKDLSTDRALLMDGGRPLLPGASVRGPLRHAFSRHQNKQAERVVVEDPNRKGAKIGDDDLAGKAFGTVSKSSRILICDARAEKGWAAAKLHMHAEDEFSAGSYGSAKRDAVRVLKGTFPIRVVIEGAMPEDVEPLVQLIDRQVALGALGHLLIGGQKTRGAGSGHWQAKPWVNADVTKARDWTVPKESEDRSPNAGHAKRSFIERLADADAWVKKETGTIIDALTLGAAAKLAKATFGETLVAWWCDPTIDLALTSAPATFGRTWPEDEKMHVDEVAFYAERAVWRAVRTSSGARFVLIEEIAKHEAGAEQTHVVYRPARLHGIRKRFSSFDTGSGDVLLREWHRGDGILGFTITKEHH